MLYPHRLPVSLTPLLLLGLGAGTVLDQDAFLTSQVWYTVPFESYAKECEAIARDAADPMLSAELARLTANDGRFLESLRVVQVRALPDLSYRAFPNLTKAGFSDISMIRIPSGLDAQFEEARDSTVRCQSGWRRNAATTR